MKENINTMHKFPQKDLNMPPVTLCFQTRSKLKIYKYEHKILFIMQWWIESVIPVFFFASFMCRIVKVY